MNIELLELLGKKVWVQAGRIALYGTLLDDSDDSAIKRGEYFAIVDQLTDDVCHVIEFGAHCVKLIGEMNSEPFITLDVPL